MIFSNILITNNTSYHFLQRYYYFLIVSFYQLIFTKNVSILPNNQLFQIRFFDKYNNFTNFVYRNSMYIFYKT